MRQSLQRYTEFLYKSHVCRDFHSLTMCSYQSIAAAFVPQSPEEKQSTQTALKELSSKYAVFYGGCYHETKFEMDTIRIQAEQLVNVKQVPVSTILSLICTSEEKLTNDTSATIGPHFAMHELWTHVLQQMIAPISGLLPTSEDVRNAIEAAKNIFKADAEANKGTSKRMPWKHLFDLAVRTGLTRDDPTQYVASVLSLKHVSQLFAQSLTVKVVEHYMGLDATEYSKQMEILSEWKTLATIPANVKMTALVHACAEACSPYIAQM